MSAERFEREIQLAASLQQPNIVPVLAAGDIDGLPYYTMPFVEGESLRARLATRPARRSARRSASCATSRKALAYAHERGVVHRDIKPDNVLLSGGTAVVTDFGIAKALSAAQDDAGGGDAHAARHVDRHAGVHGAGAGGGRSDDRSSRRHLRVRLHGVRAARRAAAVPRRSAAQAARGAHGRDAAARRGAAPRHAAARSPSS